MFWYGAGPDEFFVIKVKFLKKNYKNLDRKTWQYNKHSDTIEL